MPPLQQRQHALDIPEIVASVVHDLSASDTAVCAQVSRRWNAMFSAFLWSHLSITTMAKSEALCSEKGQEGLHKNSILIRSLDIHDMDALQAIMTVPTPQAMAHWSKLVIPTCFQHPIIGGYKLTPHSGHLLAIELLTDERNASDGDLPDRQGAQDPSSVSQVPPPEPELSTFLTHLVGLQELDLMTFPFDQELSLRAIADSLPSLNRLTLANQRSTLPHVGALQYLLNHLPPKLAYFGLSAYFFKDLDFDLDFDLSTDSSSAPAFSSLTEILIDGDMQGLELELLLPLIRRSFSLKKISLCPTSRKFMHALATVLQDHCPLVDSLTLGRTSHLIQDEDYNRLLQAGRAWKHMAFMCTTAFGSNSRETLLQHAATLESVNITRCLHFANYYLIRLLASCPHLRALRHWNSSPQLAEDYETRTFCNTEIVAAKTLKVLTVRFPMSQIPRVAVETLSPLAQPGPAPYSAPSSNQQPSHSLQPHLQQLHLDLLGTLGPHGHQFLHNDSVSFRHHLYERLATLTKLEELWLGDSDIEQISVEYVLMTKKCEQAVDTGFDSLELTIAEGLKRLSSLENLRVLGVYGLFHKIGIEELAWMCQAWPRLERIHGLFWHERKLDMVAWLKEHAPYLQFT
ncbi:hypothetical protein EDD11_005157 [Mortierella claussenii]|nr:hypothetical protein EDD11_005157 [Mortierella claussenii]